MKNIIRHNIVADRTSWEMKKKINNNNLHLGVLHPKVAFTTSRHIMGYVNYYALTSMIYITTMIH